MQFRTCSISADGKLTFDWWKHRWKRTTDTEQITQKWRTLQFKCPLFLFAFVVLISNTVRQQQGETIYPRAQSLNPSYCRAPFYLFGWRKIKAMAFEWTLCKHPVQYKLWMTSTMWHVDVVKPPWTKSLANHGLAQAGVAMPHVA